MWSKVWPETNLGLLLMATFRVGNEYLLSLTHRISWPFLTLLSRSLRSPWTWLPSARCEYDGVGRKDDVCTNHLTFVSCCYCPTMSTWANAVLGHLHQSIGRNEHPPPVCIVLKFVPWNFADVLKLLGEHVTSMHMHVVCLRAVRRSSNLADTCPR